MSSIKLQDTDRERQILYELTYMWSKKKKKNSQKQRVDWSLPGARVRGWDRSNGRRWSKHTNFQL